MRAAILVTHDKKEVIVAVFIAGGRWRCET
jgi:hypothetical protein